MLHQMNKQAKIYKTIDWLQGSTHEIGDWQRIIPWARQGEEIGKEIKPLPRYKLAHELRPAGRIDIAETKHQGAQITLTGSDLRAWRNIGEQTSQGLINHLAKHCTISRLDFAIDVIDNPETPEPMTIGEVADYVANGLVEGTLSPYLPIDARRQKGGGYTQYFGSPNSKNRVRIYDKAAEVGLSDTQFTAWCRFELQSRAKQANDLAGDMVRMGYAYAGCAKLARLVSIPKLSWWDNLMEIGAVELTRDTRKEPKWREWIRNQVEPSIAQHAKNLEDNAWIITWLELQIRLVQEIGLREYES